MSSKPTGRSKRRPKRRARRANKRRNMISERSIALAMAARSAKSAGRSFIAIVLVRFLAPSSPPEPSQLSLSQIHLVGAWFHPAPRRLNSSSSSESECAMPGWLAKGASWAISRHPRVDRALRMRITANTAFSAGAAPLQNIFAELDGRSIHFFQNPARRQRARSLCLHAPLADWHSGGTRRTFSSHWRILQGGFP
jgi:hypothetical protein